MRRLLVSISIMLFLLGCGSSGNNAQTSDELEQFTVEDTSVEVEKGPFIYRLVTEKKSYTVGSDIDLYAELEYVGDQEEMTIYHAASPFIFHVEEKTRDYVIGYAMNEPLLHTVLKKGEPLREKYTKSGGYGSEDNEDYIAFMKDFLNNGFPIGFYEIKGIAEFFTQNNKEEQTEFLMEGTVEFKVVE
ncbi:hypothetical protein [Gracilibacillus sp. YIM 98692]|uniref:hypothetical protein n=1 Tax=Gracilibacillus sp. YIM 98692 TaxID=2663532 RepID=UPI001F0939EC|nr:hypothetical protein [Gracilibacillus sp. YIM 98692]